MRKAIFTKTGSINSAYGKGGGGEQSAPSTYTPLILPLWLHPPPHLPLQLCPHRFPVASAPSDSTPLIQPPFSAPSNSAPTDSPPPTPTPLLLPLWLCPFHSIPPHLGCPSKPISNQPKLELVSAETKRLFRLFRFFTETESFDVSIEPNQTEDEPKQFHREHISLFFTENLGFSSFFCFFWFVSKQFVSVDLLLYRNREFQCFDWTKTNRRRTQTVWKRVYLGIFLKILGCFVLFRFVTKQFCLFQLSRYRFKTLKQTETNRRFLFLVSWNKQKQTETNPKQILFRFVSVRTKFIFVLYRGHPSSAKK